MTDSSDIDLRIDKGSIKGFQLAGLLLDLRILLDDQSIWYQPPAWTSAF